MPYQVQVAIPFITGLPRDVSTNVLHFDRGGGAPVLADYQALVLALRTFYTNVYGAVDFSATYCDFDNVRFKVYNLADTIPRSPVLDETHAIAVGTTVATLVPSEVACVCSISGIGSFASQRGRVYLGGLGNAFAESSPSTGFPVVSSAARSAVAAAAEALVGDASDADWTWVVYSRKLNLTFPVVKGFCDDAFDTQRRRGQDASTRLSWTI